MEVDITEKLHSMLKKGCGLFLLLVFLCVGGVYLYRTSQAEMVVKDAFVAAPLVAARVRTDGKITEFLVEDGTEVAAGDVIARIEVEVTPEQIQQMEQTVAYAKLNIEQVKKGQVITIPETTVAASSGNVEALARASERAARMNELFEMGAVSAAQRDEAAAEYQRIQAEVSSASTVTTSSRIVYQPSPPDVIEGAERQLKQAENALKNAKEASVFTEITAPVAGKIYYKGQKIGDKVKMGDVIAGVGDISNMWLEAKMDSAQIEKLYQGQLVRSVVNGKKFNGTVQEILPPEESEEDGKHKVRVSLPVQEIEGIHPDMQAELRFCLK